MLTHTPDHAPSYYAASCNRSLTLPALEGEVQVDVCIIGGGFTGLNTAIELRQRGLTVALVEAHRIGWGASGRNGGQLINGISGLGKVAKAAGQGAEDLLWDLGWRGNAIVRERVERYGIDCDLKDGFAEVAGGFVLVE